MIFKSLPFFLLLLISDSGFARTSDWLNQYLKSKSFQCKLSQDQLKNQVQAHVDRNIKQLQTSLAERGSELQSITQQRDQIEIGVFPAAVGLDFYVLESASVVLGQPNATLVFQIQTTYFLDDEKPTVKKGLWFPLAVQDPGSEKPCELVRAVVSEKERKYLPSIDLTVGDPPRVLIRRLIDVIDVVPDSPLNAPATKPAPAPPPAPAPSSTMMDRWPKPSSVPSQAVTSPESTRSQEDAAKDPKDSVESPDDQAEVKPKKKRYERQRRHYRYHHRRYYSRHHRRSWDKAPPAAEPQPPQNECAGEISTWKAVTCTLSGQKTD